MTRRERAVVQELLDGYEHALGAAEQLAAALGALERLLVKGHRFTTSELSELAKDARRLDLANAKHLAMREGLGVFRAHFGLPSRGSVRG